MFFFETIAGKAMLELVSHWSSWSTQKDYYLNVLAPSFINDFTQATVIEKNLLEVIRKNLTPEQWSNLPMLLKEAHEYLPTMKIRQVKEIREQREKNKVEKELEELNKKKERERQIEELQKQKERMEAERKIKEEKRKLQRERQKIQRELKKEESRRLKEERIRQEEDRRVKELEYNVKRKEATKIILELFNNDFLRSRQTWVKEFSNLISEEEFKGLQVQFIIDWFQEQGWKKPDKEQALCIAEAWSDVQVIARAGSGKTATTVNRAAFLVKHCGVMPSEILLLAFNREAAKEVNTRLYDLLGEKAPQAMTFHALAYAIVHPKEELLFDDESNGFSKSVMVQQIIDDYMHDSGWSERIKELMLKYFRADWEKIISGGFHLNPDEMVDYRRSVPYIGLDGKHYKSRGEKRLADYLFEHNVPYKYEKNFWWDGLNYKPDFTISLTGNALKGIVIEYFGMVGNPEYNNQILQKRNFWRKKSDYLFLELYPEQVDSFEQLHKIVGLDLISYGFEMRRLTDLEIWHRIKGRAVDEFSSIVSQFIGLCRKGLISPEDLAEKVKNKFESLSDLQVDFLRIVWKIYSEYLNVLLINDQEDFEGLLVKAEENIKGGQSRWDRGKKGSGDLGKIKCLFIDEYQDFSLSFYHLVKAVRDINASLKLFCVGDDWQAINGFAGSDLRFYKDFSNYFTGANRLMISSNYRSYEDIVDIGNVLMDGQGSPAKAVSTQSGEVRITRINEFVPNDFEKEIYNGDIITPILVRLVYSYVLKGQRVALLLRRKSGLPWYTPYESSKGKYLEQFIATIRKALPQEYRSKIIAMDTAHSYKGKQEETIIVVDAVNRSYPLLHPRNTFFEILGRTTNSVISEEERLFYVALTRAEKSVVFVTEQGVESPFLKKILRNSLKPKRVDVNRLSCPNKDGTHYIVCISDKNKEKDTLRIKPYLQENKYRWNSAKKTWSKHISVEEFSLENLLNETWAKSAKNICIFVRDEFNNLAFHIDIENGNITSKDLRTVSRRRGDQGESYHS